MLLLLHSNIWLHLQCKLVQHLQCKLVLYLTVQTCAISYSANLCDIYSAQTCAISYSADLCNIYSANSELIKQKKYSDAWNSMEKRVRNRDQLYGEDMVGAARSSNSEICLACVGWGNMWRRGGGEKAGLLWACLGRHSVGNNKGRRIRQCILVPHIRCNLALHLQCNLALQLQCNCAQYLLTIWHMIGTPLSSEGNCKTRLQLSSSLYFSQAECITCSCTKVGV